MKRCTMTESLWNRYDYLAQVAGGTIIVIIIVIIIILLIIF